MNKVVNTYWTDSRLSAQRPAARALTTLPARGTAVELSAGTVARDLVNGARFSIPSWVFFCTVVLATFALCLTVTMRTHAGMRTAERKLESMSTEVERLRGTNEALRHEAERIRTDPRAIETAARTRMNMVRANEIVVPLN